MHSWNAVSFVLVSCPLYVPTSLQFVLSASLFLHHSPSLINSAIWCVANLRIAEFLVGKQGAFHSLSSSCACQMPLVSKYSQGMIFSTDLGPTCSQSVMLMLLPHATFFSLTPPLLPLAGLPSYLDVLRCLLSYKTNEHCLPLPYSCLKCCSFISLVRRSLLVAQAIQDIPLIVSETPKIFLTCSILNLISVKFVS